MPFPNFPPFLHNSTGTLALWQWFGLLLALVVGTALGVALSRVCLSLARRLAKKTSPPWDDEIVEASGGAVTVGASLLAAYLLTLPLELPAVAFDHLGKLVRAGLILAATWGAIRALFALGELISTGDIKDTLDPERLASARARRTQVLVATRVLSVLITLVGLALTSLQFEIVRSVGVSLLASAGVASVALGFAAQRSLGALLAGVQLSISQPIRMGDAVVFRGEWGTIEDIGLTYVAIRLWDERRLLVPTTRLLEEPIENWSRSRTGLTGAVLLPVHPRTPLPLLRSTLAAILASEPLWDGRIKSVQFTDVTIDAASARVLVSASHPGTLADLRMAVRERMLQFLCEHGDGCYLPESRHYVRTGPDQAAARRSGSE